MTGSSHSSNDFTSTEFVVPPLGGIKHQRAVFRLKAVLQTLLNHPKTANNAAAEPRFLILPTQQITGQSKMRIYPKSKTFFQWRVVKAQVEFVADDDGTIPSEHVLTRNIISILFILSNSDFVFSRGSCISRLNQLHRRLQSLDSQRWVAFIVQSGSINELRPLLISQSMSCVPF